MHSLPMLMINCEELRFLGLVSRVLLLCRVVAGDGVEEWGSSLLRISVNLLVDVVKSIFCVTSLVKALLDTDYDVKATFLLYVESGNQKRIT